LHHLAALGIAFHLSGPVAVARPRARIAETDLYQPVHDYLAAQGYTVRSEVKNCDIAAVRGDDLIIIELKRNLSISLLAQAVQRHRITDSVYVAILRPPNRSRWATQSRGLQAVLRRLELGLILVSVRPGKPPVEVVFHPLPAERRRRTRARRAVLSEVEQRSGDFNRGGSHRRKLVTAYRENAIFIACCLAEAGAQSPRRLRALGTGPKTTRILYDNFFSWFERVGRGIYALSPTGRAEISHYPAVVAHYRRLLKRKQPGKLALD
jgi:hypothetical protein